MTVRPGVVYLVGAGPGDPGLLTVRGSELLQRADVVLYDRLVGESILDLIPAYCARIDVGKGPWGDSDVQEGINQALVDQARQGRIVVRLKGGDPLIFGRGWEEREACRSAGIPCEIIPGITSAIAAPTAAGIPATLRGVASSMAIFAAPTLNTRQLQAAVSADTAVFLMGVRNLQKLTQSLIAAGRSHSTPAALIERATQPGEQAVYGTLQTIAALAREHEIAAPSVLIVGPTAIASSEVLHYNSPVSATSTTAVTSAISVTSSTAVPSATSASRLHSLFTPLRGRRIVVTRPLNAATYLVNRLRELGAHVIQIPTIAIKPVDASTHSTLEHIHEFDHIVFSSRHGVRGFRAAIEQRGMDIRKLANARFAAVGPITAQELRAWGIQADIIANPARADALINTLLDSAPSPRKVLFPCGTLALETIPLQLRASGVEVQQMRVYETQLLPPNARAREQLKRGVDAVLFASPSAVEAMGTPCIDTNSTKIICIGPTTAEAAYRAGYDAKSLSGFEHISHNADSQVHIASSHSDDGLVEATLAALSSSIMQRASA